MSHLVFKNKSIYFLILFAQTKITLFIFFDNWVSKEKRKFLLAEPCSRVPNSRGIFWEEYNAAKLFETDNRYSRLSSVFL